MAKTGINKLAFCLNFKLIICPNMEIVNGDEITYIHADGNPTAMHKKSGSESVFYYLHTDVLGSLLAITDNTGNLVEERNFDAWGRARNPSTWNYLPANPFGTGSLTMRGYTFHEHLDIFGLINMNGRMYDPVLGRMLSPDNFVPDATSTQGFNRYSYVLNNPLKYIDPDGNLPILIPVIAGAFLLTTETGYDIQKYVSPVAFHVELNFGTNKSGVGLHTSIGVPQVSWFNARVHGGVEYNWKNHGITPGWEAQYGYELGVTPFVVVGVTHYNSPGEKFDQTIGHARIGVPFLNLKYANDYFYGLPGADNGDRYRTAALKIQIGFVDIGFNLFTGDPGLNENDREVNPRLGGKFGQYEIGKNGDNPDEFRTGALFVGIGPLKFGIDSEGVRNFIQNETVHDKVSKSPYFKVLDRKNKFYFQFGGGNGLW
jgi:RHS repeat-associated protein